MLQNFKWHDLVICFTFLQLQVCFFIVGNILSSPPQYTTWIFPVSALWSNLLSLFDIPTANNDSCTSFAKFFNTATTNTWSRGIEYDNCKLSMKITWVELNLIMQHRLQHPSQQASLNVFMWQTKTSFYEWTKSSQDPTKETVNDIPIV